MLFVSVCLFFSSSKSLLIDSWISPFCFQSFWSSLLSLFWIIFQVIFLFLLHLFGLLCFQFAPSFVQYFSAFSFFKVTLLRSPFPRLQGKLNSFLEEGWVLSFFWFLPSKGWSSGLWVSYRVRFVLSFFSDVQGCVRWYSGCWWLGLQFWFVCCLDEVSCTGCYWWLVDAGSYIQVVSFVWVLTIWYSRGLVLW